MGRGSTIDFHAKGMWDDTELIRMYDESVASYNDVSASSTPSGPSIAPTATEALPRPSKRARLDVVPTSVDQTHGGGGEAATETSDRVDTIDGAIERYFGREALESASASVEGEGESSRGMDVSADRSEATEAVAAETAQKSDNVAATTTENEKDKSSLSKGPISKAQKRRRRRLLLQQANPNNKSDAAQPRRVRRRTQTSSIELGGTTSVSEAVRERAAAVEMPRNHAELEALLVRWFVAGELSGRASALLE